MMGGFRREFCFYFVCRESNDAKDAVLFLEQTALQNFFILLYLTDGKGGIWGRVGEEFNETVDTKASAPTSISPSSQLEEVSNKTTNAIFSNFVTLSTQ